VVSMYNVDNPCSGTSVSHLALVVRRPAFRPTVARRAIADARGYGHHCLSELNSNIIIASRL
jgi:hypothetical protein